MLFSWSCRLTEQLFCRISPGNRFWTLQLSSQFLSLLLSFLSLRLGFSTFFSAWLHFIVRLLFDLFVGPLVCISLIHFYFWFYNILLGISACSFLGSQHASWFYSWILSYVIFFWFYDVMNVWGICKNTSSLHQLLSTWQYLLK